MSKARDRYLDVALRQTVGSLTAPDLSRRTLASCRRGRVARSRPVPRAPRLLWPSVAAAAVVLVTAVVLMMLRDRPPTAPPPDPLSAGPVARADVPVRVFGPDLVERSDRRVFDGEFVVGSETGVTRLVLAGGGEIDVYPASAVRLIRLQGQAVTRIHAGKTVLHGAPEAPGRFELAGASLEVAAGAHAEAEFVVGPFREPPPLTSRLRVWRAGPETAGDPALVLPAAGEVTASGTVTAGPGEFLCLAPGMAPTVGPDPGLSTRSALLTMVRGVRIAHSDLEFTGPELFEQFKNAQQAADAAVRLVERGDEGRELVRAILGRIPLEPERPDVRSRVLEILVRDPDLAERDRLAGLLETQPDAFDGHALIALSEGDVEPARDRLRAAIANAAPTREHVLPAIHLGLRGDPTGRRTLEWARRLPATFTNIDERFGAAAALRRLGDPGPWRDLVAKLTAFADAKLAEGHLGEARSSVLRASYFHRAWTPAGRVRMSYASDRLNRFTQEMRRLYETEAAVRGLLRRMRE